MMAPTLVRALYSSSEVERREAAEEIGSSHDPTAASTLSAGLREEDSRSVKEAMLRGLAQLSVTGPLNCVVELLKDDDPFVRAEAVEILQHRAEDAADLLIGLLQGGDKDLRKFAIDILTASPHKTPDALLVAALRDEDVNVVLSTIENIGLSRRRSMEPAVLALAIEHSHPMVVCSCLETLALIGSPGSLPRLERRFPSLAEVPPLYLQPYLKVAGTTGTELILPGLCALLSGQSSETMGLALDAMTRIVARCKPKPVDGLEDLVENTLCVLLASSGDAALQRRILRVLGKYSGSSKVIGTILPLFDHHDRLLAMAAMEALVAVPHPAIDLALSATLSAVQKTEDDPDLHEELRDLIERRSHGTYR